MSTKVGFRTGLSVGKWKLSKQIGGGGQGQVWEVRPTSGEHSPPRAMKICATTDEQSRHRFEREVALLREIQHPSVVPVLDFDVSWSEHEKAALAASYYVTERFEASLADVSWVHEAPVLALRLFHDLCSAIAYLHGRTPPVLHRDLKPTNVLLGSEPRRLAVTDLGIAFVGGGSAPMTKTNEVVGTPCYRAPEAFLGSKGDERSDIYSLGRTLEWLLTGREPDQQEPRPIPESASLSPAVREILASVLRTACAIDPANRYKSVSQLSNAVPAVVADIAGAAPLRSANDIPPTSDTSPSKSYDQAKAILRLRDVVAWRDLQKFQRTLLEQELVDWRTLHEADRPQDVAELRDWTDEALDRTGYILARAVALAEFPKANMGSATTIISDLLTMPMWNRGGLTVLVRMPETMVYLTHNLLGAVSVAVNNIDGTVEIARTNIRTEQGESVALIQHRGVLAWPESLSDRGANSAWEYLVKLPERHRWLAQVFASTYDFHTSVVGYWWRLSFLEFAKLVATDKLNERVTTTNRLFFDVPPVWMFESQDILERGYHLAFPNAAAVHDLAAWSGVLEQALREGWPEWTELLRRASSQHASRRLFFHEPDPLPPLPL